MRIRSTKPEFWRSKLIASVSWDARFVLKALESYVDDNGVGEDDVNVLVGDCFLHDLIREPSRTLARVSEAISELHQAGLVWRYEGNERNLLYVSFWETVQRIDKAQAGRNPRPDGTFDYKESVIRECVASPREESLPLAPGTGEQGNRGTGEQQQQRPREQPPAEVPQRADMNPDAILQSHGMPEAERPKFKAWLREARNVRSLGPWLTKVHDAGEVPELMAAWREASKPVKKIDPTQEWMYLR